MLEFDAHARNHKSKNTSVFVDDETYTSALRIAGNQSSLQRTPPIDNLEHLSTSNLWLEIRPKNTLLSKYLKFKSQYEDSHQLQH